MNPRRKVKTGYISGETDLMYINGQYYLLISLLLFLFDAGLIVYFLIYRRVAICPMSKLSFFSALAGAVLLVTGSIQIVRKHETMVANPAAPFGIQYLYSCRSDNFDRIFHHLRFSDQKASGANGEKEINEDHDIS